MRRVGVTAASGTGRRATACEPILQHSDDKSTETVEERIFMCHDSIFKQRFVLASRPCGKTTPVSRERKRMSEWLCNAYTKAFSPGTIRTAADVTELCLSFHPQTPRLPYPYPVAQTIQKPPTHNASTRAQSRMTNSS
ncbi:hypothetical protein SeMB42_g07760, partial [Synchytrium endobioticum]